MSRRRGRQKAAQKKKPKTFTVESIRKKRVNSVTGELEYFLKWQDYSEDENTWEPSKNLDCKDMIEEFERERRVNGEGTSRDHIDDLDSDDDASDSGKRPVRGTRKSEIHYDDDHESLSTVQFDNDREINIPTRKSRRKSGDDSASDIEDDAKALEIKRKRRSHNDKDYDTSTIYSKSSSGTELDDIDDGKLTSERKIKKRLFNNNDVELLDIAMDNKEKSLIYHVKFANGDEDILYASDMNKLNPQKVIKFMESRIRIIPANEKTPRKKRL